MLYCERAYAKVNLHLKVLDVRNDGYHNIFSIMSSVGLFDLLKLYECTLFERESSELTMEILSEGGRFPEIVSGLEIEKNLVHKACREYVRAAGLSGYVKVGIQKNIPAGGGLGGGSSDAAAMLRMLNLRYNKLSDFELICCAEKIGADVPFCISGGTALCTGIGNNISSLKAVLPYKVLIVNKGIHVDTKEAYRLLDEHRASFPDRKENSSDSEIPDLLCNDITTFFRKAQNDFESAVFGMNPSIGELKREIYESGAFFSIMTGSGSTVIGLFDNTGFAEKARDKFTAEGYYAIVTDFADM
jgi:4-diphosphocytidyl-2-C-methyl-D-erythritol kinase